MEVMNGNIGNSGGTEQWQYGNYRSAYEQVKSMREVIEDTLPEVNALLARCEGFYDQLQSDSYVEPIRRNATGGKPDIRTGCK